MHVAAFSDSYAKNIIRGEIQCVLFLHQRTGVVGVPKVILDVFVCAPFFICSAFIQKPTLPDPNEVNGTVMADPFNMDHMKVRLGLFKRQREKECRYAGTSGSHTCFHFLLSCTCPSKRPYHRLTDYELAYIQTPN